MFVHIDGVRHWRTCALFAYSSQNDKMALLKHQQKLVGALALRKPSLLAPRRTDPFAPVRWQPSRTSHLYAGSEFRGIQKSGTSSYDVRVEIKDVNLKESSLCGYLHIDGLTQEHPKLTTFFDAEIIGSAHSFKTEKWGADERTDKDHWERFDPYMSIKDTFEQNPLQCDLQNQDVLFMRWKEHFLVPDHRVEGIPGASFEGFYYISYNKSTGDIEGYYYHKTSERFQKLTLAHVADQPLSFGSYEFR
ncbi:GID complex subunit 4, VID24 [Mortierella sp. NVP85]|nr:GID complex subunit 4, VID24 [Mortierella sp. NVP85]